MSDKIEIKLIEVVEQKVVLFLDDELIATRADDDEVYVSVGHLSDGLGLDRQGQTQRIERNSVLLSGYRRGEIMTEGGSQQAYLLRVDLVPFWLAGVNAQRIKDDDRRRKVELYQQNVAKVLWEAFQEGRLTTDSTFDELLQADSDAVQAYKMLQALVKLARNQVIMEGRLEQHEERLELIETQLGDESRVISQAQAVQVSQAVRTIAMFWSKQTGRNEYGGIYGRLYERFEITSYKLLPARRFHEAMEWLTEWYVEIAGSQDIPF